MHHVGACKGWALVVSTLQVKACSEQPVGWHLYDCGMVVFYRSCQGLLALVFIRCILGRIATLRCLCKVWLLAATLWGPGNTSYVVQRNKTLCFVFTYIM